MILTIKQEINPDPETEFIVTMNLVENKPLSNYDEYTFNNSIDKKDYIVDTDKDVVDTLVNRLLIRKDIAQNMLNEMKDYHEVKYKLKNNNVWGIGLNNFKQIN